MNKQRKHDSSRITSGALSLVLALVIFFVGYRVGQRDIEGPPPGITFDDEMISENERLDFSTYWKVWRTLEEKFVSTSSDEPVSAQDRLYGSIKGLAQSYDDPYTVFLPPQESKAFEESVSGSFSGVGMEVGMKEGILTVIAPLKGTPADEAGMQPGDMVIKVDDTLIQGFSIDESIDLIRGEKGTEVTLTIIREGVIEPLEISIVRDDITIPSTSTEIREDGIFVIELYNFSAPSIQGFEQALQEFQKSGSSKLLLDLRGNPGGFLDASIEIASYFLPAGKVIVTEDFGGKEDRIHRSRGYDVFSDELEMVVLIDRGSASASEILAGALSDHDVATLVGEQTFGKGSVQELVSITDDTSLKVTIARWLTPNGLSISQAGITPEVQIPHTIEDIEAEIDRQKDAAIELLLGEKEVEDFAQATSTASVFDRLRDF